MWGGAPASRFSVVIAYFTTEEHYYYLFFLSQSSHTVVSQLTVTIKRIILVDSEKSLVFPPASVRWRGIGLLFAKHRRDGRPALTDSARTTDDWKSHSVGRMSRTVSSVQPRYVSPGQCPVTTGDFEIFAQHRHGRNVYIIHTEMSRGLQPRYHFRICFQRDHWQQFSSRQFLKAWFRSGRYSLLRTLTAFDARAEGPGHFYPARADNSLRGCRFPRVGF